jgi:choline dehydrogenase-like flavoprotein
MDDVARITAAQRSPETLELFTVHLMGTARMGSDPTRAVCDASGAVYDAAGLFIADASLLPTPLGINPQETIMVLATLVARGLIMGGTS